MIFTNREKEILALLFEGLSCRDIASRLYISDQTVKKHCQNMMSKAGANNRITLIRTAMLDGAIQLSPF